MHHDVDQKKKEKKIKLTFIFLVLAIFLSMFTSAFSGTSSSYNVSTYIKDSAFTANSTNYNSRSNIYTITSSGSSSSYTLTNILLKTNFSENNTLVLTGISNTDGSISLSWLTNELNTSYNIYRSTSGFSDISLATRISTNQTSNQFNDTNVSENAVYYYRIIRVNNSGFEDQNSLSNLLARTSVPCTGSFTYGTCSGNIQTGTRICYNGGSTTTTKSCAIQPPAAGGGGGGGSMPSFPDNSTAEPKVNATTSRQNGTETKNIETVSPTHSATVDFSNELIPITEITITVNKEKSDLAITVTRIESKEVINKLDSPRDGDNIIYTYLKIEKTNFVNSDLKLVELQFKVDKSWFVKNNVSVKNISLYRYTDSWSRLNTTIIGEDSGFAYYSAVSPGFSIFAIGTINDYFDYFKPTDKDTKIPTQNPQDENAKTEGQKTELERNTNNKDEIQSSSSNNSSIFNFKVSKPLFYTIITITVLGMAISWIAFKERRKSHVTEEQEIRRIKNYIVKAREFNISDERIRENLRAKRWKRKYIEKAFKEVEKE